MLYQRIGKRIRSRRLLKRMSQEVLAGKAEISLSFLGHIERGTRKLSVETLYNIAMALDCSVDELMETGHYSPGNSSPKDLLQSALAMLETIELQNQKE